MLANSCIAGCRSGVPSALSSHMTGPQARAGFGDDPGTEFIGPASTREMVSRKGTQLSTVGLSWQPSDNGLPVKDDQHANNLQSNERHDATINRGDFNALWGNTL